MQDLCEVLVTACGVVGCCYCSTCDPAGASWCLVHRRHAVVVHPRALYLSSTQWLEQYCLQAIAACLYFFYAIIACQGISDADLA